MTETDKIFNSPYANRFVLYTSAGESMDLQNHYFGEALFITLGGPSLVKEDLAALRASGVMTMGVNNTWSIYRPDLWVSIDPASTFLPNGWADPRILKLVPCSQRRTHLRRREPNGEFVKLGRTPGKSPNTFFFNPHAGFEPANFLDHPRIEIGSPGTSRDGLGFKGQRSVFLAAIRFAVYFGFKRVYLLGADFHMADPGEPQYATGEEKGVGGVVHNNRTYRALNARMEALGPYLTAQGVSVVNLTTDSGLTCLPSEGLHGALEREALSGPEGVDSVGYYAKHEPEKDPEP